MHLGKDHSEPVPGYEKHIYECAQLRDGGELYLFRFFLVGRVCYSHMQNFLEKLFVDMTLHKMLERKVV